MRYWKGPQRSSPSSTTSSSRSRNQALPCKEVAQPAWHMNSATYCRKGTQAQGPWLPSMCVCVLGVEVEVGVLTSSASFRLLGEITCPSRTRARCPTSQLPSCGAEVVAPGSWGGKGDTRGGKDLVGIRMGQPGSWPTSDPSSCLIPLTTPSGETSPQKKSGVIRTMGGLKTQGKWEGDNRWILGFRVFPLLSFLIHVVLMTPSCRALVRPDMTLPALCRLCPWRTAKSPLSYTKAGVLPGRWAWVRAIQTGGQEPSRKAWKDLPGGPVVKTSPFNVGVVGLIPDQGARIPHDFWPKNQNVKTEAVL